MVALQEENRRLENMAQASARLVEGMHHDLNAAFDLHQQELPILLKLNEFGTKMVEAYPCDYSALVRSEAFEKCLKDGMEKKGGEEDSHNHVTL